MLRRLLIIGLLILIGCSAKDPVAPTAPTHIMPLAVGHVWEYDWYNYQPGDTIPSYTYDTRLEVVSTATFGDELWYETYTILANVNSADTIIDTGYFTNRQDGLYWSDNPDSIQYLVTRFPASTGLEFNGLYGGLGFYPFYIMVPFRVSSTDAPVSVPLGDFTCYDFESLPDDPDTRYHTFYTPNVGIVMLHFEVYNETYGWYSSVLAVLKSKSF